MKKYLPIIICIIAFTFLTGFGFSDGPGDIAKKYIDALFERRYEDAIQISGSTADEDAQFEKYDSWMQGYFSPTNLKIIKVKKDKNSKDDLAVLTFNYTNATNAKSTERVTIKMNKDGGKYKVAGTKFHSRARRTQRPQPVNRSNSYGQRQSFKPVTIPQNNSSKPSGSLMNSLMSDPSKINSLMSGPVMQMMSDPDVMSLVGDPKFQQLANDPIILNSIMSGNMDALKDNPKIKSLLGDPRLNKLMNKYQNSGTGQGSMNQILNLLGK